MEGEATPTRSVPLPMVEEEEEEEGEEGEAEEEEAGGGPPTWGPWPPRHFEFLLKVLKWNQLSLIHFINVIAAGNFSHNCK